MHDLLRAQEVSKSYGGIFALKNADFALRAGEVHALLGDNGAGKSTLIKILAGSAKPNSGHIFLEDRRVEIHSPIDSQRLGIAIICQDAYLSGTCNSSLSPARLA